jgi:hypothetical protein
MNNPIWGGKREGAGRPVIHTDPTIKERTKKFRATDSEWELFVSQLPADTRNAFVYLKMLIDEDYLGRITISAK